MAVFVPAPNLPASQLIFQNTQQRQIFRPCKVCFDAQNPSYFSAISITRKPSSIPCSSTFLNCSSIEFEDTHLQKLVIKPLFLKNQSVADVSLASKMIREYTANGSFEDAIGIYLKMLDSGVPIEEFSCFPSLIKAFGGLLDLKTGRQIHGHVLKIGVLEDIYVANSLLALYWKCGAVEDALALFEKMPNRDLVSWNTMISGFEQSMQPMESLMMLRRMVRESDANPNRVACLAVLSSSASCGFLDHGKEIHAFIIKNGLDLDPLLVNGLIGMYTKCGKLRYANHVFETILERESLRGNTIIWNVMISGYVFSGCLLKAFTLFREMLVLGIELDSSTMVAVLVLCSQLFDLQVGRQIHGYIFCSGLHHDAKIEMALLDMYCKCGNIQDSLKIFERSSNLNFVMWGAIISGCAQNGYPIKALELFDNFRLDGGLADPIIVLAVLRACSSLTFKLKGMETHGLAVKTGFNSDAFVGGALTDMYAKCGDVESAQKIFHRLSARDVVSWNALVSGCVQNDYTDEALKAFRDMQFELVRPNAVTVASILSVCACLSVLIMCKQIHCYLIRNRFEPNVLESNSLMTAYARCGAINSACIVFKKMPLRNEVSWNSMISGLGMHGHMDAMLALFDEMKASNIKPDHITFTAVLSACSHVGRIDEGWKHFRSMVEDYKIKPKLEQYTCMVDLLGRAGHLDQAYNLILDMPCQPDVRIWGSLLGSCKIHCNVDLAELVANQLFDLDSSSVGYHILLSNIYEDSGKWDNITRIRTTMKDKGFKKGAGCSWIEVNSKIHIFIANDRSHYQSEEIYVMLGNLTGEIKGAGYIPQLLPVSVGHDEVTGEGTT